ncbi:MAG: UbiA prenyltransferase family protein [Pseudomonadota bacterium]
MMVDRSDEGANPTEALNTGLKAAIDPYIAIARPDHWFKNVFVLPGAALGVLAAGSLEPMMVVNVIVCLVATCLTASANYTINEWLDAEFDRHHPVKKNRPSVTGKVEAKYVYTLYVILAVSGLGVAAMISSSVFYTALLLLVMGLIYNVRPMRSKDRAYFDVLSESVNNPIRFMLGWFAITSVALPPSSILLAYWMGGAFLMGAKRLSEYRFIDDPSRAGLYRRSFQFYDENKLLVSTVFYALMSAFFFGVFLIKYRIELLLIAPGLALLFSWYLSIALKPASTAQAPEKLYKEKKFVLFVGSLSLLVFVLLFIELPWMNGLVEYTVIQ